MKKVLFTLASAFAAIVSHAQYTITTVAGGGTTDPADGIPATSAKINQTNSICADASGNLLIAGNNLYKIYKADAATGSLSIWIGNGTNTGENIPATDALIPNSLNSIRRDNDGNIYYATIRKVYKIDISTGLVKTVAGSGSAGPSGDGGPATAAGMAPKSMAVDGSHNLYFTAYSETAIRKVNATTGIITTIAGDEASGGTTGDDGPAVDARLSGCRVIAAASDGTIYFPNSTGSLAGKYVIRKINTAGIISKLGGDGTSDADGSHISIVQFYKIGGIAVDNSGNIYIHEGNYNSTTIKRIWKINAATGICNIIAGGGTAEPGDGGPATAAKLKEEALDLSVNPAGTVLFLLEFTSPATSLRTVRKIYLAGAGVDEIPQSHRIGIYPNPSTGSFTLKTDIADEHETTVCDALGKRVYHTSSKRADETIDLTGNPAGVYYVSVIYGTRKWTETVVINAD